MQTKTWRAVLGLVLGLAPWPASALEIAVTQYGVVPSTLPWVVANEVGFLKRHGLDIDRFVGSNGGGTTIRNMMAGGTPFADVATSAAIGAVQQAGLDLRIVFGAVHNMGEGAYVVRNESPIKTFGDLAGHVAGYNNPRSTTEMILRILLAENGLAKTVKTMPTGGVGATMTLLEQNAVDTAMLSEPALTRMGGKFRVLLRVTDALPKLVWEVGVTTPAFAKAHPDLVRNLILARREAVDYIYAQPKERY